MNEKQKLINEDLKRFKLLMEYDFYIGEEEEVIEPEGDLLTEPEDEMPEGGEDLDGEDPTMGGEEIPDGEVGDDEEFGGPEEEPLPEPEPMGDEPMPEPEPMEDEPMPEPEPMEDEIELDVTQLVQGTEAAKASADHANQQIGDLLAKFDNLTQSLDKMDAINATINSKFDEIEHEIETRNPTPEEQLEMRSMDSFPYNLKLTDYWSEKEGHYDAMGKDENGKEEEFVLTQDEVDQDYNAIHVKDSFGDTDEEEQIKY